MIPVTVGATELEELLEELLGLELEELLEELLGLELEELELFCSLDDERLDDDVTDVSLLDSLDTREETELISELKLLDDSPKLQAVVERVKLIAKTATFKNVFFLIPDITMSFLKIIPMY